MTETTDIRRRPNGSIDIDHYARIGRALHGSAICDAASMPDRLLTRLSTLFGKGRMKDGVSGRPLPAGS